MLSLSGADVLNAGKGSHSEELADVQESKDRSRASILISNKNIRQGHLLLLTN